MNVKEEVSVGHGKVLEACARRGVIWLNEREGALFGLMGGWRSIVDWSTLDMADAGLFGANVAAQLGRWRWDHRLTDAQRRSGAWKTALDVLGVPAGFAAYLGFDPGREIVDTYGMTATCAALTACWRHYQPGAG